ncbi:uncharacterized protein LOC117894158 [Drosophila subobscura]|uniref:uncharacterized protein LOC117894158 n=1 Tax=Drosophila subobscura TaxID=7241 RepID=UPI00155B2871|nr:uncharacterized protein LOC117894158 [Drosophila subobscura]
MLRIRAAHLQQLRFNNRLNESMPDSSLPESPKDLGTRGPVVETYVGKQTNQDEAVLPMPPHKIPLDIKGDLTKAVQAKKITLEEVVQKSKLNLLEELQKQKEALALQKANWEEALKKGKETFEEAKNKQLSHLDNAIQKIKSGEALPKINLEGIRKLKIQDAWKKAVAQLKSRF